MVTLSSNQNYFVMFTLNPEGRVRVSQMKMTKFLTDLST